MADIRIDTSEVMALPRRFSSAAYRAPHELDQAAVSVSEAVAVTARNKVPKGRTGRARSSVRVSGGLLVAGGHNARYFGWLDFGGATGRRGATRRQYRRGGRYIYPALVSEEALITRTLDDALTAALKAGGFSGG